MVFVRFFGGTGEEQIWEAAPRHSWLRACCFDIFGLHNVPTLLKLLICLTGWFLRSVTDFILLLILVCCWAPISKKSLLGLHHFKLDQDDIWQGCTYLQVHTDVNWQSWISDKMSQFQLGGHDVVSCRKVLPPGECTHGICPTPMQQCLPVPDL